MQEKKDIGLPPLHPGTPIALRRKVTIPHAPLKARIGTLRSAEVQPRMLGFDIISMELQDIKH